jgi:hypothetical protein
MLQYSFCVQTTNLDGESNLKVRSAVAATKVMATDLALVRALHAVLPCPIVAVAPFQFHGAI